MTSTTVDTYMVASDHYEPVNPLDGTATVKVLTGDTVYYADKPYVTATSNLGSLAVNASHTFTSPAWLLSASLSSVSVTLTSEQISLGELPAPVVLDSSGTGGALPVRSQLSGGGFVPLSAAPLVPVAGTGAITDIWVQGNFIYFARSTTNYIGRANLDGTGINETFCNTGATALWSVCADANFLYWTDNTTRTIGRANLDGSAPNNAFKTSLDASASGYYVRVTATNIYWSVYRSTPNGAIGVAKLDGTTVNATLITGCQSPHQFAIDAAQQNIYWSEDNGFANFQLQNGGTVGHATLTVTGGGTGVSAASVNHSFIATAASDGPTGVCLDATYVYWMDFGWPGLAGLSYQPRIGRAKLDGSQVENSYIVLDQGFTNGVWPLALSSGVFYWSPNQSQGGVFAVNANSRALVTMDDAHRMAAHTVAPYIPSSYGSGFYPMGLVPPVAADTTYSGKSLTVVADALYMVPFSVPWPTQISGVGCAMGTASGNYIIGLFDSAGNLVASSPSAAVAATTLGRFQVAGQNAKYYAKAGPYYAAIMFDGTAVHPYFGFCVIPSHGTTDAPVQGGFAFPGSIAVPSSSSSQFVPSLFLF